MPQEVPFFMYRQVGAFLARVQTLNCTRVQDSGKTGDKIGSGGIHMKGMTRLQKFNDPGFVVDVPNDTPCRPICLNAYLRDGEVLYQGPQTIVGHIVPLDTVEIEESTLGEYDEGNGKTLIMQCYPLQTTIH